MVRNRDRFVLDTHGNEFECHYLPHFNQNLDTNTNTKQIFRIWIRIRIMRSMHLTCGCFIIDQIML
jgi:hypothetical protein